MTREDLERPMNEASAPAPEAPKRKILSLTPEARAHLRELRTKADLEAQNPAVSMSREEFMTFLSNAPVKSR